MTDLFECPYCGDTRRSLNGTGSDIACCGEIGHVVPALAPVVPLDPTRLTNYPPHQEY